MAKPRVLVPVMTDFEEIEFVTVVDVLRRAGITVVTAGLSPNPIAGAHGIQVHADASISEVEPDGFDAIALPGGKGTPILREDRRVAALIRSLQARGQVVAAICAAPTVLSDLGLLKGRNATSHPSKRSEIACGRYLEKAVVVDGQVLTSRGAGTALAFALDLAARLVGVEKAEEVAMAVLADWEPAGAAPAR
ncbi:MAG: DJ-1/PfpI family protein [Candidatus Sericytochromatia bacterium]|nr:DJ-1/PfpI family protein [Candidatus Tanganyikabacteria bacterium]